MSLKKVEQVKADKWFKIWDIIVYGVLLAAVVVLIISFAIIGNGGELDGVCVSYNGEQVFVYNFDDGDYNVFAEDRIIIKEETAQKLILTFYTENKKGFNEIEIDKKGRSAKVTSSNCSLHKDCVYTAALDSKRSVPIICTPHALSIAPLSPSDDGNIKT